MTGGLVSCVVGDRHYAMRGADIREIVRAERMRATSVPGRGDGSIGRLVVGGEPIPVFSLGAVLAGGSESAEDVSPAAVTLTGHHVVVTHGAHGPIGWLADRVVRSHLANRLDVLPLPAVVANAANGWFEGLLIVDDAPVLLLSPRRLDPRAKHDEAQAIVDSAETATVSAAASGENGPALVVMFSSPALPPCGAPRYALSARRIAAVVQSLTVMPVPGCPPHVTGVAVWRGLVMPVVDFRSNGDRSTSVDGHRFLIARCGRSLRGGSVAFAVDAELGLHKPTPDDRADRTEPTPAFIAGTFNVLGNRLALLDLDALLLTGAAAQ